MGALCNANICVGPAAINVAVYKVTEGMVLIGSGCVKKLFGRRADKGLVFFIIRHWLHPLEITAQFKENLSINISIIYLYYDSVKKMEHVL